MTNSLPAKNIETISSRVSRFHSRSVWSALPVTIRLAFSDAAMALISPVWPSRNSPACRPVAEKYSISVPSLPPVTTPQPVDQREGGVQVAVGGVVRDRLHRLAVLRDLQHRVVELVGAARRGERPRRRPHGRRARRPPRRRRAPPAARRSGRAVGSSSMHAPAAPRTSRGRRRAPGTDWRCPRRWRCRPHRRRPPLPAGRSRPSRPAARRSRGPRHGSRGACRRPWRSACRPATGAGEDRAVMAAIVGVRAPLADIEDTTVRFLSAQR